MMMIAIISIITKITMMKKNSSHQFYSNGITISTYQWCNQCFRPVAFTSLVHMI